jgi:hypothetical protein
MTNLNCGPEKGGFLAFQIPGMPFRDNNLDEFSRRYPRAQKKCLGSFIEWVGLWALQPTPKLRPHNLLRAGTGFWPGTGCPYMLLKN